MLTLRSKNKWEFTWRQESKKTCSWNWGFQICNLIWFISSLYHFWDECCQLFVSICFLVHCWLLHQSCVRSSLSGQEGIRKKTLSENLVSWLLDCSEGNIRGFTNCSNTELQTKLLFCPSLFLFFLWATKLEDLTEHWDREYETQFCVSQGIANSYTSMQPWKKEMYQANVVEKVGVLGRL